MAGQASSKGALQILCQNPSEVRPFARTSFCDRCLPKPLQFAILCQNHFSVMGPAKTVVRHHRSAVRRGSFGLWIMDALIDESTSLRSPRVVCIVGQKRLRPSLGPRLGSSAWGGCFDQSNARPTSPAASERPTPCSFSMQSCLMWDQNHHLQSALHRHRRSFQLARMSRDPRRSPGLLLAGAVRVSLHPDRAASDQDDPRHNSAL